MGLMDELKKIIIPTMMRITITRTISRNRQRRTPAPCLRTAAMTAGRIAAATSAAMRTAITRW